MRKLTLDLDALAVESFDTAGGPREETGTVRAHVDRRTDDDAVIAPLTWWRSCWGTCEISCGGTCNCSEGCTPSCPSGGEICCA